MAAEPTPSKQPAELATALAATTLDDTNALAERPIEDTNPLRALPGRRPRPLARKAPRPRHCSITRIGQGRHHRE